ncbi:uncharacterized protein LOC128385554 [Panonychus citri]|uniref:uncharacterized protein LOC128385554 n=1 Tax=Panonychus citri TaxID=50023 RepID=UPI002307915F|nr:uncharacterized protein LOC128385554 [Panonychus citri]
MSEIKTDSTTSLLIPVTTEDFSKISSSSNTPDDQGLDLTEPDNLSSIPSSSDDSPLISSASSSDCLPSSSISLDSLSSNSDEKDDEVKEEFVCLSIELPEKNTQPDEDTPESLPAQQQQPQQPQQPPQSSSPPPPATPQEPKPITPIPTPKVKSVNEMPIDYSKLDKTFSVDFDNWENPKRKGFFSCFIKPDGKLKYMQGLQSLRYLKLPADYIVSINLRDGYTKDIKLVHPNNDPENLLRFILDNKYDLSKDNDGDEEDDEDDEDENGSKENRPIADIISTSETLTLIMSTPFSKQKAWTLIGVNVGGSLILKEKETSKSTKSVYEDRKFLEAMARRNDGSKIHPEGYDWFYTVSRGKIGNHRLLYSSRISGAINKEQVDHPIDSMKFVSTQLRSVEWNQSSKSRTIFWRNSGLNLYCSTLLDKIDCIIYGEKEPGNWIKEVKVMGHHEIAKKHHNWSPKTCIDFMDNFLNFIREASESSQESVPFEVTFVPPKSNIGKVMIKTLEEPFEKYFPSWYLLDESPEDYCQQRDDRLPLVKHLGPSLISRLSLSERPRVANGADDNDDEDDDDSFNEVREKYGLCSRRFGSSVLVLPENGQVNINLLTDFDANSVPGRRGAGGGGDSNGHRRRFRSPQKSMHFLEWISANKRDLMTDSPITDEANGGVFDPTKDTFADFVCDSFVLRSIMSTPHISSDDTWSIVAVKMRGIIYLIEGNGQSSVRPSLRSSGRSSSRSSVSSSGRSSGRSSSRSSNQSGPRNSNTDPVFSAASSHAGLKFKELLSARFDGSHSPVNGKGNRDTFWMVCKTNVGTNHRVLYNARTDCALDDKQLSKTIDEAAFVEIRTRPASINEQHWEKRAIAWWITSILSGTKLIFCGERDDDFFVRTVTKIYVDSLPKPRFKWSPKACVDFLDETLTFIKSMVLEDMKPYRFNNTQDKVICTRLDEPVDKYISFRYIEHSMYEFRDLIPQHQDDTETTISTIQSDHEPEEIKTEPEST